jgi:hypothetical protein
MLEFRRFSKQWYWDANHYNGTNDDIMVFDSSRDGGVKWEFRITFETFTTSKDTAIRINIYEDSVKALKSEDVVTALIDLENTKTLDDVEHVLKSYGFREKIDKEAPHVFKSVRD